MGFTKIAEVSKFVSGMPHIRLFNSRVSDIKIHKESVIHRTVRRNTGVPIWEKSYLTLEEAAAYSGIGREKLRHMSDKEDCPFVLWNGTKRLIKRRKLDEYMDRMYSI